MISGVLLSELPHLEIASAVRSFLTLNPVQADRTTGIPNGITLFL